MSDLLIVLEGFGKIAWTFGPAILIGVLIGKNTPPII